MNDNVTVVILAAGLGTRMRSKKAKVLHEAGGDTLLNHVIRIARNVASPERIVVVVGHQADTVKASVSVPGIRFAEQREQKGTGHAVLCAESAVSTRDGRLIILNGDGPLVTSATVRGLLEQSWQSEGGSIVVTNLSDPTGYGRILRDGAGNVASIVEQKSATPEQLAIREVNPGVYSFNASHFWKHIRLVEPNNAAGEYYVTDMVEVLSSRGFPVSPYLVPDETELLGINTRVELSVADRLLRLRKANELMLAGVTMEKPETMSVDVEVEVGQDTYLEPGVQLRGKTRVGSGCRIGSGAVLRDCEVADDVVILPYVVADSAQIGSGGVIGPFSRLRLGTQTEPDIHIGNFVELKNTVFRRGAKAGHLAYLGDSDIGAETNIGAGTITCNFDGATKHKTAIGEGAFIGSNSTLVAPVKVGEGAYIAAGSTVTKDVESDALAIGRAHQVAKPGWAKKRREANRSRK
ncbi:MAG: bifunctional UDP-N-acetylglucosamine diphosphorylase/glucosamine-1-phosphate N-acetyltransferase GlmU [Bryobacteraceae bacterium]